jgi:hypothetical protein
VRELVPQRAELDGEIVAVRAERDRAALLPLPPTGYLVVERTTRVVARDRLHTRESVADLKPRPPEHDNAPADGVAAHALLGPEPQCHDFRHPGRSATWHIP